MKVVKRRRERSETLAPVPRPLSPFWPFRQLQEDIGRLLEEPLGGLLTPPGLLLEPSGPPVDVYEDKHNVFVKVELPGMKKEEIEVFMSGDMLNIRGERKEEAEYNSAEAYRSERYFGRFHRSLPLPAPVEPKKIEAHYKDGILTVTCPKAAEAKRKEIEIKVD